ncbi:MAG: VanW family protein [Clostridiales bacterium]|nr:VanW family protein [Clostridiales bacterium]
MKKILCTVFACVLFVCCLTGCSDSADVSSTSESTTTTTTTTTTTRTTEDLSTTFKEASTAEVYDALTKDSDGDYPYKLASYTTYYQTSNETRTVNIKNAVEKLNNIKIPAGKTFSFNQTVGKRTVLAGYEETKVVQGDEFVDGLGGGICQVSSTIFQAALRANLKIVVRACHSLEISYVDLGGDATVQWNSQDFQFKNDTDCDLRLKVTAKDGTLTCAIYASEDLDIGDVDIKITKDGSTYTLTRTVDGVANYTCTSSYSKAKTSTTTTTKKSSSKTTTKKN